MKAIVFGAGGVGLGFLGELLTQSGYQPTFVDVDQQVVAALNRYSSYTFNKIGDGIQTVRIDGVQAIDTEDPAGPKQLSAAFEQAQVVFTAAGARALPAIGSALAHSLRTVRFACSPLNVFCCENHHNAALALRQATEEALSADAKLISQLRFVNTVVARMCQRLTTADRDLTPLTAETDIVILAEAYSLLPVDGDTVAEPRPVISGVEYFPAPEFEAWDKRKLFAHNGTHALLAVLGKLRGYRYLYEAAQDAEIDAVARGAMWEEVGGALVNGYSQWFSTADYDAFATDLYGRLTSRDFADAAARGARNTLRMIQPEDGRLSRATQYVAAQGILPRRLCLGIAGVLRLNGIAAPDITTVLQPADGGLSEDIVELVTAAYTAICRWQDGAGSLADFTKHNSKRGVT